MRGVRGARCSGDPAGGAARGDAPLESLPRGPIHRQVFVLALPMLGEQVGSFMVGFVDTLLAGRVSKEATAAVGAGGYMGWFLTLAFTMLSVGVAAIVARSFGQRDARTAERALNQSFVLSLVLGVGVSVLVYAVAPGLSSLLTQTDAAHALFTTYVRIDALGYTAMGAMLTCGAVVRAAGDTRTPMAVMLVVNVVNVVASAALVYGWLGLPQLGVAGIAIGTVIARVLGAVLLLLVLARGLRGMRLRTEQMRPDAGLLARLLRVGLPAGGEAFLLWVGQMGFIVIVAHSARGDAATVNFAAHTIAMRMEAITYLPAVAWATAAATMVGQYLGARRPQDAARCGHVAALQGALLSSGVGAGFLLLAGPIFRLMSDDADVVAAGVFPMRLLGFVQPVLCMAIIYIGALRGAGDTRRTMVFSLVGLGLRLPIAYVLAIPLGGGLLGAWVGMWADNIGKFLMGWARFARGGWKTLRV